jgi:hypothetical protein
VNSILVRPNQGDYQKEQTPPTVLLSCTLLLLLMATGACTTLPDVRILVADSRASMTSVPVSNGEGKLSSQETEAVLERLRSGSNPAEILKGNLITMAAAGAGPLITGNRASLLVDGGRAGGEQPARLRKQDNLRHVCLCDHARETLNSSYSLVFRTGHPLVAGLRGRRQAGGRRTYHPS